MKFIYLLCLLLCATIYYCDGILLDSPGAQIRISTKAFNDELQSLIRYLKSNIHKYKLPDLSQKRFNLSWWLCDLWIKAWDISINDLQINEGEAKLELTENGLISIRLGTIKLAAYGTAYFDQTHFPEWRATFYSWINLTFDNVDMDILMRNNPNNPGRPLFEMSNINLNLSEFGSNLEGDWIAMKIANPFKSVYHKKIKEKTRDILTDIISSSAQTITNLLANMIIEKELAPKEKPLSGFYLNYQLAADPFVSKSDYIIPITSQFWYSGGKDKNSTEIKPSGKYPTSSASKDICLDLDTKLIFATASQAFNLSATRKLILDDETFLRLPRPYNNYFYCNAKYCNCSEDLCFIRIDDKFLELCNDTSTNPTIKIHVESKLQSELNFKGDDIYAIAISNSTFVIENKNSINILETYSEVEIRSTGSIKIQDWNLFGNLSINRKKLIGNSTYIGVVSEFVLKNLWELTLGGIANLAANDIISSGIPLPFHKFATFSDYQLVHKDDKFTQICADLQIDFDQIVNSIARQIKHKKKIDKFRNIYQPYYIPVFVH